MIEIIKEVQKTKADARRFLTDRIGWDIVYTTKAGQKTGSLVSVHSSGEECRVKEDNTNRQYTVSWTALDEIAALWRKTG